MVLDLGGNQVVRFEEVIGVFDLDKVSTSRHTRFFLMLGEHFRTLHPLGDRIPASLVLTDRGDFLSPISAQTLTRRLAENQVPHGTTYWQKGDPVLK